MSEAGKIIHDTCWALSEFYERYPEKKRRLAVFVGSDFDPAITAKDLRFRHPKNPERFSAAPELVTLPYGIRLYRRDGAEHEVTVDIDPDQTAPPEFLLSDG